MKVFKHNQSEVFDLFFASQIKKEAASVASEALEGLAKSLLRSKGIPEVGEIADDLRRAISIGTKEAISSALQNSGKFSDDLIEDIAFLLKKDRASTYLFKFTNKLLGTISGGNISKQKDLEIISEAYTDFIKPGSEGISAFKSKISELSGGHLSSLKDMPEEQLSAKSLEKLTALLEDSKRELNSI
jgi:hypothetical protein